MNKKYFDDNGVKTPLTANDQDGLVSLEQFSKTTGLNAVDLLPMLESGRIHTCGHSHAAPATA